MPQQEKLLLRIFDYYNLEGDKIMNVTMKQVEGGVCAAAGFPQTD